MQNENIRLRDWKIKDLPVFKKWNTGHYLWMDFNGPYYPKLSQEALEARILTLASNIKSDYWSSPRQRLVIADIENDLFLGTVNWYWQSKETNWKSIGIAIYDDRYWGRGIGFEALSLWVDYLFKQDENLVRLDLRTWSGNKGMMKLGEKLGFKLEATFRKARIVKGEYYDSIGMGILREEWMERSVAK